MKGFHFGDLFLFLIMRTFIITAGGIGKRMGGTTPKQFLMLANKPVLMHTLANLYAFDSTAQFILTLPLEHLATWEELCEKHQFNIPHEVVAGGEERFHSVRNALLHAKGDEIAVHDGVRPFVSAKTLHNLFVALDQHAAVIPIVPVKDSMRKVNAEFNHAVNRSEYALVQTPQVFQAEVLNLAYQNPFSSLFTDDASVVEASGQLIHLVPGNEENVKLTNPLDMELAQLLVQSFH